MQLTSVFIVNNIAPNIVSCGCEFPALSLMSFRLDVLTICLPKSRIAWQSAVGVETFVSIQFRSAVA